jgi:hypothetical protein
MSYNKSKSAIDLIYELNEKMDKVMARLDVIDTNIKLSNNKMSKINKAIKELRDDMDSMVINSPSPGTQDIVKSGKEGPLVLGKIKTFGRIVDPKLRPIQDVLVKVYNEEGDLIKTRKTDRDGYWDVRLPSGSYGVEYIQKGFRPASTRVELTDDMESYEVK